MRQLVIAALLICVFIGSATTAEIKKTAVEEPKKPVIKAIHWQMVPQESSVLFTAMLSGAPLKGGFKDFTTDIYFDPDNLKGSSARADVKLASVTAEDASAQKDLLTPTWFSAADYPTAVFQSEDFRRIKEREYEAHGTLTLKGHTEVIKILFTLAEYTAKTATTPGHVVMDGKTTLNRTRFGIGQGEWAGTDVVADAVEVNIHIVAKTLDAQQNTQ